MKKDLTVNRMSNKYDTHNVPCIKCGELIECMLEYDYPHELYEDEISEDDTEMRLIGDPKCICGYKPSIEHIEKFIDG